MSRILVWDESHPWWGHIAKQVRGCKRNPAVYPEKMIGPASSIDWPALMNFLKSSSLSILILRLLQGSRDLGARVNLGSVDKFLSQSDSSHRNKPTLTDHSKHKWGHSQTSILEIPSVSFLASTSNITSSRRKNEATTSVKLFFWQTMKKFRIAFTFPRRRVRREQVERGPTSRCCCCWCCCCCRVRRRSIFWTRTQWPRPRSGSCWTRKPNRTAGIRKTRWRPKNPGRKLATGKLHRRSRTRCRPRRRSFGRWCRCSSRTLTGCRRRRRRCCCRSVPAAARNSHHRSGWRIGRSPHPDQWSSIRQKSDQKNTEARKVRSAAFRSWRRCSRASSRRWRCPSRSRSGCIAAWEPRFHASRPRRFASRPRSRSSGWSWACGLAWGDRSAASCRGWSPAEGGSRHKCSKRVGTRDGELGWNPGTQKQIVQNVFRVIGLMLSLT